MPSKADLRKQIKVGFESVAEVKVPTEDIVDYFTDHLWGTIGMWLLDFLDPFEDLKQVENLKMFETYLATAKQSLQSALKLMTDQEHQDEDSAFAAEQLKALISTIGEVRVAID